jgi:hypothetical protein
VDCGSFSVRVIKPENIIHLIFLKIHPHLGTFVRPLLPSLKGCETFPAGWGE